MKNYLAWVGQNATTGSPHPKTGRLSMYGDLKLFKTRVERDLFVVDYYDQGNPSVFAVATNKQDAKSKYCAGMSGYNFDEYINYLEFG